MSLLARSMGAIMKLACGGGGACVCVCVCVYGRVCGRTGRYSTL